MSVQLVGRVRPSSTTAEQLVAGSAQVAYIAVCNVGSQAETFRVFHSIKTGPALYDEETALHWDIPIGAQETVFVEFPEPISLGSARAIIGVRSSTASNLTFTAYG